MGERLLAVDEIQRLYDHAIIKVSLTAIHKPWTPSKVLLLGVYAQAYIIHYMRSG